MLTSKKKEKRRILGADLLVKPLAIVNTPIGPDMSPLFEIVECGDKVVQKDLLLPGLVIQRRKSPVPYHVNAEYLEFPIPEVRTPTDPMFINESSIVCVYTKKESDQIREHVAKLMAEAVNQVTSAKLEKVMETESHTKRRID